jgi:aerobic carbon-monoxide dehydrogenase medium subunit
VRHCGTIGGSVAHADPASDLPTVLLALGATFVARGRGGERTIAAADMFSGFFQTALAPDEILTEIRVPAPPPRSGGEYAKLERKVGDFATAAAAAQLSLSASGTVERVRIALTNMGPTPVRAEAAEARLAGRAPDAAALGEASRLAAQAASPKADRRGDVEYKREMARVMTRRALEAALARAGGR